MPKTKDVGRSEAMDIGRRVEQLVSQHGAYDPLDLLTQLGRLDANDVEAWRNGGGERLADQLFGDPFTIGKTLASAARYALSLGLKPVTATPPDPPGAPAGMPADWASTRYLRVEAPQLDLFFDGQSTNTIHQLIDALADHDPRAAERALDQLESSDPGDPLVAAAPQLIAMLAGDFSDPERSWIQVEAAAALADAHLGDRGSDFLRPLWTKLAHSLKQARECDRHPSAAWARIPNWPEVAASLGSEPALLSDAELLMRGVVAQRHLHETALARHWFCHLCWRYPQLEEEIQMLASRHLGLSEILEDWRDQEFDLDWGWQELPCWLLLRGALAPGVADDPQASDAFTALATVLRASRDIQARKNLQAVHPGVLRAFLDRQNLV